MSDMQEVDPGAGAEDKPTHEENSYRDVVVAQLVKVREEALKQKQLARRAAWQEEVKAGLDKRAEFKLQMEGIPRTQISSWKEKQILSKISPKWRRKFLSERTQFLFHTVFPILSQSQPKIPRWNFTLREILNSRLASKLWKDIIDISVSTTSAHYQEMFMGLDQNRFQYAHSCIQFFSLNQLKTFNRKCEQEYRGSNPLPFRQLYIGNLVTLVVEGYRKLGLPYWIEMEKLLGRWGKEIWTALYMFEDGSIEMMYEFLIKYLSLMPNLRELAIVERDRAGGDMMTRLGKDVLGQLKLRMERKPLPELPHLRSIYFARFCPAPLIEAMLAKYGSTLESLKIEAMGFDNYSGEYLDPGEFVAGRELPLKKYSCFYSDSSWITHWELQFPALEELRLDYLQAKEGPEVENIFKTVNSVASSIRRLRLKIHFKVPEPIRESDWRDLLPAGMRLELPHLEGLDLTLECSKISDVDFLLPLLSLKELTFSYLTMGSESEEPAKDGSGIIQLAEYRDRLYESNVWTLLPELKQVTLNSIPLNEPSEHFWTWREQGAAGLEYTNMTTTVHTRDGYRQHHCDQNGIRLLTEQLTAFTTD